MFLLFLITVHLNARIPEKLVFWTVSYTNKSSGVKMVYLQLKVSCIVLYRQLAEKWQLMTIGNL